MGESNQYQADTGLFQQRVVVQATQSEHVHAIRLSLSGQGVHWCNWLTPEEACRIAEALETAARVVTEGVSPDQLEVPF